MEAQLYDDAIWAKAASELGLSLVDGEGKIIPPWLATTSHEMRGQVGGHRIRASQGVLNPNVFSVVVTFHPPLLLGLSFRRHAVGISVVDSIEPSRGRALTSRVGDLGRAIDACGNGMRLVITDTTVSLVNIGLADGVRFYTEPILRAVDLANRAIVARSLLEKTHWEGIMIQSWSRLANAESLQFDAAWMQLRGVDGHHKLAIWLSADDKLEVRARVELLAPLGIGLSVSRGGMIDRAFPFTQLDIRTGDKEFDRAFVVGGEPSEAVCERLSPSVRANLMELDRRGKISLSDDAIDFSTTDLEIDVARLFGDLGALARDLEIRPTQSPYR